MNHLHSAKPINKTDFCLYGLGALMGMAILVSNNYASIVENSRTVSSMDSYFEKIIHRMDSVSGQLSAWGNIDIRKEMDSY